MSENLYLKGVDLYQTPTQMTYLILSLNLKGNPDGGMEGVRRRYILWCRSLIPKSWTTEEHYERLELIANVEKHIEVILAVEKPKFYLL